MFPTASPNFSIISWHRRGRERPPPRPPGRSSAIKSLAQGHVFYIRRRVHAVQHSGGSCWSNWSGYNAGYLAGAPRGAMPARCRGERSPLGYRGCRGGAAADSGLGPRGAPLSPLPPPPVRCRAPLPPPSPLGREGGERAAQAPNSMSSGLKSFISCWRGPCRMACKGAAVPVHNYTPGCLISWKSMAAEGRRVRGSAAERDAGPPAVCPQPVSHPGAALCPHPSGECCGAAC